MDNQAISPSFVEQGSAVSSGALFGVCVCQMPNNRFLFCYAEIGAFAHHAFNRRFPFILHLLGLCCSPQVVAPGALFLHQRFAVEGGWGDALPI